MNLAIANYIADWKLLAGVAVAIAVMIEGDITVFIVGFLVYQGVFNFGEIIPVVFGSVLIGDILWYQVGFHLNNSSKLFRKLVGYIPGFIDKHLSEKTFLSIFISKFTYGIHHIVLIRLGAFKVNLRNYIKYDIVSIIVWISVIGSLGYVSGTAFTLVKNYLRGAELWLLITVIIFLGLEFLFSRILKKRL